MCRPNGLYKNSKTEIKWKNKKKKIEKEYEQNSGSGLASKISSKACMLSGPHQFCVAVRQEQQLRMIKQKDTDRPRSQSQSVEQFKAIYMIFTYVLSDST